MAGGFDEEWAGELKGDAEPYFGMPTYSEDGLEMVDGGGFMAVQGNFFDFGAVHILTTGTLRRFGELAPAADSRSAGFRPNLVIETAEDGFVETGWAGGRSAIGPRRAQCQLHRSPLRHDDPCRWVTTFRPTVPCSARSPTTTPWTPSEAA